MSPNIPAHQALRLQVEASVGRRPDRDWVRSSGRPRNRWIDQLRQDHQRCDVYVGGKVRVSEFMIFLDLQHRGSK